MAQWRGVVDAGVGDLLLQRPLQEAARLGIAMQSVEVSAGSDFEGVGLAARNIRYQARVVSSASDADVARLLRETDTVAEIHNTLRAGASVALRPWEADSAV